MRPDSIPTPATREERNDPKTYLPLMRLWETYRAEVLPKDVGLVQVVECRRAFMAGAKSFLDEFLKVSECESQEEADGRFEAFAHELEDWFRIVGAGLDANADRIAAGRVEPGDTGPRQ